MSGAPGSTGARVGTGGRVKDFARMRTGVWGRRSEMLHVRGVTWTGGRLVTVVGCGVSSTFGI